MTVNGGVTWKFNPPSAPHFYGLHEILLKAARRAMFCERLLEVPMNNESLHLTEHQQRLHDVIEAFACQNTPSFFEEVPAQVGGGEQFRFVLDPIIERRSAVMGVREHIFRTWLEQQGRLDSRRQNISFALAQGLHGAIETLLDDATIHDRDCVFLRFHSPRYDNSFSRGLRVSRWHQEPDTVTAFLPDLAQKLNSEDLCMSRQDLGRAAILSTNDPGTIRPFNFS